MSKQLLRVLNIGKCSFVQAMQVQQKLQMKLMEEVRDNNNKNKEQPPQTGSNDKFSSKYMLSHCKNRESDHRGGEHFLILVEHYPVFTAGLRDRAFTDDDVDRLQKLGADVCRTNRGGLATFHGPGQLVVYPILNLKSCGIGLREYVSRLERCLVSTCQKMHVAAHTTDLTGVWVGDSKIGSIGVHARRHVTSHGVALNCSTDLTWFDHIVPCGLNGVTMTSLSKEAGSRIGTRLVEWHFLSSFVEIFNFTAMSDSAPLLPLPTLSDAKAIT